MNSKSKFVYIVPFIAIYLAMNAFKGITKQKKVKKKVRFSEGTKTHDGVSTEKMLFCEHMRDVFRDTKKFPRGRDKIINILSKQGDIDGLNKLVEFSEILIQRINENNGSKTSIIAGGSRMYPYILDHQFIRGIELSIQEINKKITLISD